MSPPDLSRLEALESSTADLLARVFRQHNRLYGRALEPLGVTALHAHILLTLWLTGPLRVGDLRARLSLSSSTFSGAIDRMERLGLLRRERDPEDGRAFRLVPASWPKRKRERLERAVLEAERAAFAALDDNERTTLAGLLAKLADDMDARG